MEGHTNKEEVLRLVCGGILWALSSLLTAALFLSLADGDWLKQIVLGLLAIGLEGAKILSWRMGRGHRVLAVSLIILSGMGSLGAALQTAQHHQRGQEETRRKVDALPRIQAQAEVDRQIALLLNRLEKLPPEYTTGAREINAELGRLRTTRESLLALDSALKPEVPMGTSDSVFEPLARVFGLPVDVVMLLLLLFLAVNLEVAALVLAGHSRQDANRQWDQLKQAFLEAAMEGAPLPVLHGRDVTARRMGISFYEAKRIVADLKASGTIRAVGKRLVLCQPVTTNPH